MSFNRHVYLANIGVPFMPNGRALKKHKPSKRDRWERVMRRYWLHSDRMLVHTAFRVNQPPRSRRFV